MSSIFVLSAMIIWIGDIVYAQFTDNSWKTVGIVWGLLAIGCVFFGVGLTL